MVAPQRLAKSHTAWKRWIGMIPGTIGMPMPARRTRSTIDFVVIVIEEELGDGAVGAGVDLALQDGDLGVPVGALRMPLGIGGDRNLAAPSRFSAATKLRRIAIAGRMRPVGFRQAARRIAAERHEALDPARAKPADRFGDRMLLAPAQVM